MKNLKLIALVIALAISTLSFANNTKTADPKSELREQIVEMLGKTIINTDLINNQFEVIFTLNNKSEIVIISVNGGNKSVDNYVKSKLNYKKVNVNALNVDKIYHMPLRIK